MFWFGGFGKFNPGYADCSEVKIADEFYFFHVVPTIVWYWLPVLPVIASCFVSLYVLQTSKRLQSAAKRSPTSSRCVNINKSKDSATMTIVLLTSLYVVFNLPMCVANIFWTIEDTSSELNGFFNFDHPAYYFNNLVYCLCVPLNSQANPILYFCRIRRLRDAVIKKTMKLVATSFEPAGESRVATQGQLVPAQKLILCASKQKSMDVSV